MYRAVKWNSILAVSFCLLLSQSCTGGAECFVPMDCPLGFYCLQGSRELGAPGECVQECVANDECPNDGTSLTYGFCSNEGKCEVKLIPPRIRVLSPENDTLLSPNTRRIQIRGEVETVADTVQLTVTPALNNACEPSSEKTIMVKNPEPGRLSTFPFLFTDYEVDPGLSSLLVTAQLGTQERQVNHYVEIPCDGCAEIVIDREVTPKTSETLSLRRLVGAVTPASVTVARWKVRNEQGDVLDGPVEVTDGVFSLEFLPLFPGRNRVQVVVTGKGDYLYGSRCSINVFSGVAQERGLRAILTWDSQFSDLDVHIVKPGGRLFDPLSSIWSTNQSGDEAKGLILDDFDGFGPELGRISELEAGTYGVVVKQEFYGQVQGSNALMQILNDGRTVSRRPQGPQYFSDRQTDLWIVGTLTSSAGKVQWTSINERVDENNGPITSPEMWPNYYSP